MRRALVAIIAALAVAGCGSQPPSAACKRAQAHEFAVVRRIIAGHEAALAVGGIPPLNQLQELEQEQAALKGMQAAGCPHDMKALTITYTAGGP